jgi:hypothetical protein
MDVDSCHVQDPMSAGQTGMDIASELDGDASAPAEVLTQLTRRVQPRLWEGDGRIFSVAGRQNCGEGVDAPRPTPRRSGRGTVAMQIGPVVAQPALGLFQPRHRAGHELPEAWTVIHLDQMGNLVRGDVVEHMRGRQHQPPRKRQQAAGRA